MISPFAVSATAFPIRRSYRNDVVNDVRPAVTATHFQRTIAKTLYLYRSVEPMPPETANHAPNHFHIPTLLFGSGYPER